jgi:hypothetical protein
MRELIYGKHFLNDISFANVRKILCGLLGLTTLFSFGQEKSTLRESFKNPEVQYKPMPFWHINGELTNEGIEQQMRDAKLKANFGGVAVLPVTRTKPDFLSESYFEKYDYILKTAKKLDMNVIMYDDADFPSGNAGGMLEEKFPQDIRKSLEKREYAMAGYRNFKMVLPNEPLMAAVAMNTETLERIDISPYIKEKILTWRVPEGNWKLMIFTCIPATYHKGAYTVDYLDTTSVKNLMSLTFDEYEKRFKPYFQNTIQLTFFDDVGFWRHEKAWTPRFNDAFQKLNGYDPTIYYPALWYDIGPETESVRIDFFNTRAELLAEGYPRLAAEWATKQGIKSTGHPPGNYAEQPVDMNGDIFKFYRHSHMPLADLIIGYGHGRDGFKLISSASNFYDKPITATEIYGALKENTVDSLMLYRALMEIQARGINFIVPHGMWYDPTTVNIPPLISPYSKKLSPGLATYSEYAARSCFMLQGGRNISEIAVLYPISSLQGDFRFDAPENKRGGAFTYPEADYLKISEMLTNEIRQDFTFVHPEFLASDKYQIQGEKLRLNNTENFQDYKLLIIPAGKVISLEALKKIKEFYDNGGKVIATGLLPSKSAETGKDREIIEIINEIFGENAAENASLQTNPKGGKAIFLKAINPETLTKAINELQTDADIIFTENIKLKSELGVFSYVHKVKDGKDIYFFANSSDDVISTEILIRGKLKLENWNPHNGDISEIKKTKHVKINDIDYTQYVLKLKPVCATFWVSI